MASLMCGPCRVGVFGTRQSAPRLVPHRASLAAPARLQRGALQVVAAEEQKKKRTDSAVKRAQIAESRRKHNKAKKSACATRVKKVIKAAEALVKAPVANEAELAPLEVLVSEAYKELDSAVSKGILHQNTVARRKARVATYKRQAVIAAGLYTPAEGAPGYSFYQRLQASKAKAAAAAN